jgi:hypothetical protein
VLRIFFCQSGIPRPDGKYSRFNARSTVVAHGAIEPEKTSVACLSGMLAFDTVSATARHDIAMTAKDQIDLLLAFVVMREVGTAGRAISVTNKLVTARPATI